MIQDIILSVRDFLELGGPVLNIIAIVIFVMWLLAFYKGLSEPIDIERIKKYAPKPG